MSLTAGRRLLPALKERLRRTPEVTGLLSQLGRPEDGTDPTLTNNLEIFVTLKPLDEWRPRMRNLGDLVAEMESNLKEVRGSSTTSPSRSATTSTRTSPGSSGRSP